MNSFRSLRALLLCALALGGCAPQAPQSGGTGPVKATATIAQIADLVRNVAGDRAEVTALMGEGVDPHLYKASQGDIAVLSTSEIIFYNGLMLEGRMGDVFVKMASMGRPVVPVTEAIPEDQRMEPPEFEGHYDPHVWMDASLWAMAADLVAERLSELRPESEAFFAQRAADYRGRLIELHEYAKAEIGSIPAERRVLITAHDAFGYFGRAYGIEVMGLQGISTASEAGLRDMQNLINVIIERGVKAVFVESSVPPRNIEALVSGCRARGHEVVIGGELFSDAMGAPGTEEGTYIGMFRHNVQTIVKALK